MKEQINYSSTERKPVIQEMETLYQKLVAQHKKLRLVKKLLKQIDADIEKMETYYYGDWINDYQHFDRNGELYEILFEDPIFNNLQDIHNEKMKILKQIVKKLKV